MDDDITPDLPPVRAKVGVLGGDGLWSVAEVLRASGLEVADFEPAPKQVAEAVAAKWHYGRASVRAGLLGHPRAVLQLLGQLKGARSKGWIWKEKGLAVDGFRPEVDPEGVPLDGIEAYRLAHLAALARLVSEVDRLILPLCRRKAWVDGAGTVFGPKRGTLPTGMKLSEISFDDGALLADLDAVVQLLQDLNPRLVVQVCLLPSLVEGGEVLPVSGVLHDPVFDALLVSRAKGGKGAALLAHLAQGGDLDAFGGAPAPVAAPVEDERDRRKRRKEKRRGKENPGKVVCEDELLEAFAK